MLLALLVSSCGSASDPIAFSPSCKLTESREGPDSFLWKASGRAYKLALCYRQDVRAQDDPAKLGRISVNCEPVGPDPEGPEADCTMRIPYQIEGKRCARRVGVVRLKRARFSIVLDRSKGSDGLRLQPYRCYLVDGRRVPNTEYDEDE